MRDQNVSLTKHTPGQEIKPLVVKINISYQYVPTTLRKSLKSFSFCTLFIYKLTLMTKLAILYIIYPTKGRQAQ